MVRFFRTILVGAALALGAAAAASAAEATDPVVGTWRLNLAKSTFSPGPAPTSQTRTYTATADGIEVTIHSVAADGKPVSQHSSFKYDGKDYPFTGNANVDTAAVLRIDGFTVASTLKRAGKVVGTSTRSVSRDGNVLTLSSRGTDARGKAYDNVMVFDRH